MVIGGIVWLEVSTMHTACLFVLLGLCQPTRAQVILGAVNSSAIAFDSISTQTRMGTLDSRGEFRQEGNPVARPFVNHGPAIAYASAAGEALATAWLADKMKHSSNRVLRKIWWLPQTVSIGSHVAAGFTWYR